MTKTEQTSANWVAMAIFSVNMATALRRLLLSLFYWMKNWLKFVIKLSFLNCKSIVISLYRLLVSNGFFRIPYLTIYFNPTIVAPQPPPVPPAV